MENSSVPWSVTSCNKYTPGVTQACTQWWKGELNVQLYIQKVLIITCLVNVTGWCSSVNEPSRSLYYWSILVSGPKTWFVIVCTCVALQKRIWLFSAVNSLVYFHTVIPRRETIQFFLLGSEGGGVWGAGKIPCNTGNISEPFFITFKSNYSRIRI